MNPVFSGSYVSGTQTNPKCCTSWHKGLGDEAGSFLFRTFSDIKKALEFLLKAKAHFLQIDRSLQARLRLPSNCCF